MRKTFKTSFFLLAMFVLTMVGAAPLKAQTQITLGQTYTVDEGGSFDGMFELPDACTLAVYVTGDTGTMFDGTSEDAEMIFFEFDASDFSTSPKKLIYYITSPGTYVYKVQEANETSTYRFEIADDEVGGGGSAGGPITIVPGESYTVNPFASFEGDLNVAAPGPLTVFLGGVYSQYPAGELYNSLLMEVEQEGAGVMNEDDGGTYVTYQLSEAGIYTYKYDNSMGFDAVQLSFSFEDAPSGGGESAGFEGTIEFGKTYEISGAVFNGNFSVTEGGVITVTASPALPGANDGEYLSKADEDASLELVSETETTAVYNITKGKYGAYFYSADPMSIKYEFVAGGNTGGGDDNPNQPGELPEGYQAMEMKSYTVNGVGAVKLAYTPTTSGTLVVTQTGDFDSHLYNVVPSYDSTYGYGLTTPLEPQGGTYSGTNPYTLKYGVAAGVTYYYVGKTNPYDDLTAVSFEFEGVNNDNTIQLDTPYVVNYESPIYTFTPEETGILTVTWTNPIPSGEPALGTNFYQGSTQFFLYSDYGLSRSLPMLNHEEIEDVGCKVFFNVVAGEHYYLYLDALYDWQCVFTLEEGDLQAPSIKEIEPVPGTAFDVVNYPYSWNLILSPNEPTLDKVTLTYVPANDPNGDPTTIDLTTQNIDGGVFPPFEWGGDAMRISSVELNNLLNHNEIANETDIVFTLYGVKAAGEYVTQNLMVQGDDYVNIGENGLVTVTFKCGTPIALLTANWPSPFLSGWERGDKAGMATLTYDKEIYHVGAVTVTQGHQYYGSEGGGDTPPYSVTLPGQNVTYEGNTVNIDFTGINFNMPSGTNEVTITVSGPTGQNGLPASYDGIPVLQHYATYTTNGAVVIPEDIINYIEPRDGVTFSGLSEGEIIEITLMDNVKESTTTLTGVLSEENGAVLGTFGFTKAVGDRWIYELEEDFTFVKDQAYLFTVTAMNADDETLGSQVVYWYGSSEGSATEVPTPTIIVPLGGEAEVLYDMFEVTWGYNALTENAGDDPMQATLTFPDGTKKTVKGQITDANGFETGDVTGMPASEDNALMFRKFMSMDDDMNLIQQYGTYTVDIPEGIVLVNGTPNPAATLSFRITGEGGSSELLPYATIFEPASEFVTACLSASFTWDLTEVTATEKFNEIAVKVDVDTYTFDELDGVYLINHQEGGNEPGIWALADEDDEYNKGNVLVVNLPFDVYGTTGQYVFMIPEGAVVDADGKMNPAQEITITVLPQCEATLTVTPECNNWGEVTVKSLETVTLSWGKEVALNEGASIRLTDEMDETIADLVESGLVDIDGNDVVLNVANYTEEDGTYVIYIGEGAFLIGGMTDMSISSDIGYMFTYIVSKESGIANLVDAEDGKYVVYSLDGVMILSTDNAANLKNLESGRMYIINGKKVLVRK